MVVYQELINSCFLSLKTCQVFTYIFIFFVRKPPSIHMHAQSYNRTVFHAQLHTISRPACKSLGKMTTSLPGTTNYNKNLLLRLQSLVNFCTPIALLGPSSRYLWLFGSLLTREDLLLNKLPPEHKWFRRLCLICIKAHKVHALLSFP